MIVARKTRARVVRVATDVPGSRDVVEDGISGVLVPPGDAAALADALSELAASEKRRRQIGRSGRDRILAKYRLEREVRDHVMLYNEALNVG